MAERSKARAAVRRGPSSNLRRGRKIFRKMVFVRKVVEISEGGKQWRGEEKKEKKTKERGKNFLFSVLV